eukprot:CAMPEP_0170455798 /NCGR_PEP_ID=MMETSP0123-20130129/3639_1 /TAXON_ID=182087 /ORGANISM="Favella ehrenbergii, Strain Fehren 1" /LENGTH=42 /DNA_ID= /DNA_START= /DNA_END= /DNA_ORIENTATION=
MRVKREQEAEKRRIEAEAEARKEALRERRAKLRMIEMQKQEE